MLGEARNNYAKVSFMMFNGMGFIMSSVASWSIAERASC